MTTDRAQRVYLSFFEGEGDNAPRLARAIRKATEEARIDTDSAFIAAFMNELYEICDELEDPTLLDAIYGNCYD